CGPTPTCSSRWSAASCGASTRG
ncbi:MAG: hypothetical protein AVDCRST_MAG30-2026, partial [uncultured Solirubrobacteraceae bacterium]